MTTQNHQPSDNGERDLTEDLLVAARQFYQLPGPQLQEKVWMRMKEEIDLRRAQSGRRYRVGRVAIAASLLMIGVGLGGYAAGRAGLALQAQDAGRVDGPDPGRNDLAAGAHTPRANPDRPTPPKKAQAEKGESTERHEAPSPLIAQQTGTASPFANLVTQGHSMPSSTGFASTPVVNLVTQGHPVASTSFLLEDGDHALPLLPMDPLRPFAHLDWFYPVPAHVTDCKFDPAKRALKFKLRLTASRTAVDKARRVIAHAYNAKGHLDVKPEDINIQPLQRVGYRLALDTGRGDLELKVRQGGPITTARMSVTAEIPPDYKGLIDNLATDPDFVSLVATGSYDFEYSTSASTEARGLRSASLRALQEIYGGKPLTGPVIVDRRGRQEYLQRMRNEVVVWARGYGMEAEPMTELALKQLGALEPMSFREFLDRPGQLMIWNTEMGRLELQPEKYDLLAQETRKLLEEQDEVKSLSKAISDLAIHESDEGTFYSRLQETFDLHAKAKGGVPAVFSADLAMDLKKTYDQLSSGERKAVSDYKRSASNESDFESKHLKKSDELFRGKNHIAGATPKGWDLYLITDESIVGETLFGSHQVKMVDVKTVAISEEFPIEVEKIVVTTDPPPPPSIPASAWVPIGVPLPFAGRTETVPQGYLIADGREVRRDEYPELFSTIGTRYGRGDGEKTFNLPDYRGEFLRGADNMGTARGARGVDGGRVVGSAQAHAFQQHAHGHNLTANTLHNHRIMDVYHINGGARVLTHTEAGNGVPLSMNALIAGWPYGYARTPETPIPPDGIPAGQYAGPEQARPFEGGHKLAAPDSAGHAQDDRWAITTDSGNPKQPVEGSIDGANKGSYAEETRPRNVAALYIIRAK